MIKVGDLVEYTGNSQYYHGVVGEVISINMTGTDCVVEYAGTRLMFSITELKPIFDSEPMSLQLEEIKCQCGAPAVNSNRHSIWCDVEKNKKHSEPNYESKSYIRK